VEFHGRHDLQIGAGGGATWERCCFGVPTLGIVLARNQSVTLPALAEQGAIALYAPAGPAEARGLGKALVPLLADAPRRRAMAERSRQVCDGQGARRVALKLAASTLALRAATVADARRMFDWRNHEETRAVSGNAEKIPWPAHTAWLDRVLADAQRHLFVAEIGGDAVGVIRFDVDADQQAEVSLYLDPSLTGLGLGPRLLAAGETLMNTRQVAAFRARVLGGNDRSRQMFERSGYRFEGEAGHKPGARTIHEVH
jgi:RimJ/RimL family protein N-acetyltransferase